LSGWRGEYIVPYFHDPETAEAWVSPHSLWNVNLYD
jgi:hypothetical protein